MFNLGTSMAKSTHKVNHHNVAVSIMKGREVTWGGSHSRGGGQEAELGAWEVAWVRGLCGRTITEAAGRQVRGRKGQGLQEEGTQSWFVQPGVQEDGNYPVSAGLGSGDTPPG